MQRCIGCRLAVPALVFAALVLAGCRTAADERPTEVGEPDSGVTGAPFGTGGATPTESRTQPGATAQTPVDAREHQGEPMRDHQPPKEQPVVGPEVEALSCASDADCAVTRTPAESCCNSCGSRAIRKDALKALEDRCRDQRAKCPEPMCAPDPVRTRPACQQGQCTLVRADTR